MTWNIVTFMILIINVAIVWSYKLPTISNITQNQVRDVGGQVDLSCSVDDADDYPVLWLKHNINETETLFISTNTELIIRGPRLSLRFDAASATYTLSIKDLEESDAGLYKCQVVVTPTVKVSKVVELQVRSPSITFDNSTRSTVTTENDGITQTIAQEKFVDIGGQVDLACSVHDAEEYPVLWVCNIVGITVDMNINEDISMSQMKYDRNETMSLIISTNTLLIVKDSRFSLRLDPASATYTLSVCPNLYPPPNITLIPKIPTNRNPNTFLWGTYTKEQISNFQETDAGLYRCKVIRAPDFDEELVKVVDVHVRRPPIIFENSTKSLVSGEGGNTTSKVGFISIFQKLTEAKLEVVQLKKKLIDEEIEQQLLRKSMLKELFGLQKENMLLTREILKSQLENKSKELNGTILAVPSMLP